MEREIFKNTSAFFAKEKTDKKASGQESDGSEGALETADSAFPCSTVALDDSSRSARKAISGRLKRIERSSERVGEKALMASGDEELMAAFLRGDKDAVGQVRCWISASAHGFRANLTIPWEDLVQDLSMEITSLFRRDRFRGESGLRTYVSRVAKYRCLNLLRDQRRLRWNRAENEVVERIPSKDGSPLERIIEGESVDALRLLMEAVPAECKKLWIMILDGRSYREMSQELRVAEGTLRVRVLRCRRRAFALWETRGAAEGERPLRETGE